MVISVGVSDSILRQSAMAWSDYPNPSFPPRCTITCATPACGMSVYCPSLKFPQSTLDDLGHNRGGPSPTLWAACHQLVPTQGHQELSCTECGVHMAAATCSLL